MSEALPQGTPATLKVDSDWATVLVISDNALIERVPNFAYPPNVRFTGTQFSVSSLGQPEKKDFPFLIVNSIQPVDIITAHGDASTGLQPGNVTVEIFAGGIPINLFNGELTGDTVNAKVFPKVPLVGPIN